MEQFDKTRETVRFGALKITIENPKGSYKSFVDEHDIENTYPLKGVTYPVDYGCIEGYIGEDGDKLDVFVGSGNIFGFIKVSRPDIKGGIETKVVANVTNEEFTQILEAYQPVLLNHSVLAESELLSVLKAFESGRNT